MKEKILELLEKEKDEILENCKALVRFKTVNPPGDEYLTKDFLTEFCEREGISYEVFEKSEGRTRAIGRYSRSDFNFSSRSSNCGDPRRWKVEITPV